MKEQTIEKKEADWSLYLGQQMEVNGKVYVVAQVIDVIHQPPVRSLNLRRISIQPNEELPNTIEIKLMPRPNYQNKKQ